MKFKSYQVGGAIYTPFISNRGTTPQTGATPTTTASSKSDKIGETIEKEIINIIKESGIESDVNLFLTEADNFLNKSRSLSATSLFGGDVSYTMSDLIHIQKLANSVKENKSAHKDAATNLTSQQAWNDVAMTTNGGLYVMTEKGLEVMDASEYAKADKSKVQALTNSQLMGLRESRPELAFATHYLYDMSGAIGFKTITDQLVNTIKDFGTVSRSEYVKNNGPISQSAWDGMQILIGNGPEGYYKATTKSEREHINSAVNYLWDILGKNGQARLRAEIAATGGDPNNPVDRSDLILKMLQHHTNFEQSVDFDKSATEYDPDGDGKGSSNTPKYVEQTRAERYASGNGFGNSQWLPILSSDKSTPMHVSAQNLGPVLSKDEKTLFGDANLEEVLNDAYGIGGIVDRSAITFGDIPITWDDASKLMFEGGTNMYRALIPVKRDSTGKLRPNFELQEKINEMNENSLFKNMSAESIRNVVADIPGVRYNEQTGLIEATNVAPFLVLQATASTDTLSGDLKSTKYLHDLSNEEDRKKKSKYNDLTGTRPSYGGGEKRQSTGNPKTTWWMGYQFYSGNVFIPINDSIIAASIYNDQLVPQETYVNMSAKEQARQDFQQKQMVTDYLVQNGDIRLNF